MKIEWTKLDSEQANREGWNVYNAIGSDNGDWQVQRNDDQNMLSDDGEAWLIIANGNKPHHKKALAFMKANNKTEYNLILNQD
tara:strand:+ start:169 stop:417 length:249 start_codon:yes stop_codon:yes gene_type:complete